MNLRVLCLAATACVASGAGVRDGAGSDWTRIGPWNIFDGVDPTQSASMGELHTRGKHTRTRHYRIHESQKLRAGGEGVIGILGGAWCGKGACFIALFLGPTAAASAPRRQPWSESLGATHVYNAPIPFVAHTPIAFHGVSMALDPPRAQPQKREIAVRCRAWRRGRVDPGQRGAGSAAEASTQKRLDAVANNMFPPSPFPWCYSKMPQLL